MLEFRSRGDSQLSAYLLACDVYVRVLSSFSLFLAFYSYLAGSMGARKRAWKRGSGDGGGVGGVDGGGGGGARRSQGRVLLGFSVSLEIFPRFRHMRSRVGFPDSFSFSFPSFSHARRFSTV